MRITRLFEKNRVKCLAQLCSDDRSEATEYVEEDDVQRAFTNFTGITIENSHRLIIKQSSCLLVEKDNVELLEIMENFLGTKIFKDKIDDQEKITNNFAKRYQELLTSLKSTYSSHHNIQNEVSVVIAFCNEERQYAGDRQHFCRSKIEVITVKIENNNHQRILQIR